MLKQFFSNDKAKQTLVNFITDGRLPHTLLLEGEDGSGKMTFARMIAAALLCEHPQPECRPCGECRNCRLVMSDSHPDVTVVQSEQKANAFHVDQIRALRTDAYIRPNDGTCKVYLLRNVHYMTEQAQNALLKTIEEPPAYAVILLLTTNAESFLPTILSRCVTLNLKAVPDEKIKKFLMAHYQIPDYQADVCVAFAQGNVGKAIQLAASDDFNELKASALQLIKRLHDIDLYEMTEAVKQISEYKLQINDYFDLMMIWYRDVLYYKATKDVNGLIFKDEVYDIKRQAEQSSYNGIEEILQALSKAQVRLNANVNFDLVIELLLLTIKEN